MADEKTKAMIQKFEKVLKENSIGVWEEDSEEENLEPEDVEPLD